jgi:PEGA domain
MTSGPPRPEPDEPADARDKRREARSRDSGREATHETGSLVWPPPDEELEGWEIVPLSGHPPRSEPIGAPEDDLWAGNESRIHDPHEAARPVGAKPAPASPPAVFESRNPPIAQPETIAAGPSIVTRPAPLRPFPNRSGGDAFRPLARERDLATGWPLNRGGLHDTDDSDIGLVALAPLDTETPRATADISELAPSHELTPGLALSPEVTDAGMTQRGEAPAGRLWQLALLAIALLSVAQITYLIVRPQRSAAATTPLLSALFVQSAPSGAEVYVDGQLRGRTPFRGHFAVGRHQVELRRGTARRTAEVALQAGTAASYHFDVAEAAAAAPPVARASIEVRSDPSGARVRVGGNYRGATPLTLRDLEPGRHTVEVSGPFQTIVRQVTVAAGQQALVIVTPGRARPTERTVAERDDEPSATPDPPAVSTAASTARGWVTIDSPIALRVMRNGDLAGTSEDTRIPLPAGEHTLQLLNESLGFKDARTITVPAGRGVRLAVDLPQGTLNINAIPWAEVFVDGKRVGETPVAQLALPIGAHDVVFRHPNHGERRLTVLVKVGAPGRTFVDFTK